MVEVIPKKKQKIEMPSKMGAFLFWFFLTSFVLLVGLYLIFQHQGKSYQQEAAKINNDLQSQKHGEEFQNLKRKLLTYKNKFAQLPKILSLYETPSKIFADLLNKKVEPEVILKSISFKEEKDQVEISGYAPNKDVIALQLKDLESSPEVEQVVLKSIKIGKDGNLEFLLDITIKPNYLVVQK